MTIHVPLRQPVILASRNILGTPVAELGWDEAIRLLRRLVAERSFTRISFLNAHNANVAAQQRQFADTLKEFIVLPDGIGVDLASKMLYGSPFPANLNGTDFIPAFLQQTSEPLTVALLGTTRANARLAAEAFGRLAPQHRFVFLNDGFFNSEQETEILEQIATLKPDVLLVAMGVPRQEMWIAKNITAGHCTLPIAVGALLDFMSGAVPRAPLLLRRLRLEWFYRLLIEPRRLFRRYVLGNPIFLARVLGQKLGLRGQA